MHLMKNKDVRLRLAPLLRLMRNERKTNDYMILLACYNGKSTELVCHFVSVCNGTSSSVIIFNPFSVKRMSTWAQRLYVLAAKQFSSVSYRNKNSISTCVCDDRSFV